MRKLNQETFFEHENETNPWSLIMLSLILVLFLIAIFLTVPSPEVYIGGI